MTIIINPFPRRSSILKGQQKTPTQKHVDLIARTMMIEDGFIPTHIILHMPYDEWQNKLRDAGKTKEQKRSFRKAYRKTNPLFPKRKMHLLKGLQRGQKRIAIVSEVYRMKARHFIEHGNGLDAFDIAKVVLA